MMAVEKEKEMEMERKEKVLWVSRHEPLPAQIEELRRKLGDVEIVRINRSISGVEEVVEIARKEGARFIVPVLPLSMIARLAEYQKDGFTVLFARMTAVATTRDMEEAKRIVAEKPKWRNTASYADGVVRVFEFQGFERLVRVELITEPW